MSKTSETIYCQIDNHIATLTLNRPTVHNAFDDEMIAAILAQLNTLKTETSLRALVVTHAGQHFCAGGDLNWMKRMHHFSLDENIKDATQLALMLKTLYEFPLPTIAMIRGAAYGGGAGLAAACKIVLAADTASFCFSEVKLGLVPATISPYVIQAMGARAALNYFMTAEKINAQEALRIGLCHRVVAETELDKTLEQYLKLITQNGPTAIKTCIELAHRLSHNIISEEIFDYTSELIAALRVSPEGQAGLRAFLEKRQPSWIKDE